MDFREYEIMYEAESNHWWYRGLRAILFRRTGLHDPASRAWRILDAGCGTGGTLAALHDHPDVRGFDYSPAALHFCRVRQLRNVVQGSLLHIPFPADTFDLIISNDVLCDEGTVDDRASLGELYRVLKPGGRIFINLPAYPFLRSEHDIAAAVERRYTKRELREKLETAGFHIRRLAHWNAILFPIVLAVRLARRPRPRWDATQARSDIHVPAALINSLLTAIIRFESRLLDFIDLPFGSSLITVSEKPGRPDPLPSALPEGEGASEPDTDADPQSAVALVPPPDGIEGPPLPDTPWMCIACNAMNEGVGRFCANCGRARPWTPPPAWVFQNSSTGVRPAAPPPHAVSWACPRCGHANPREHNYCIRCGLPRPAGAGG